MPEMDESPYALCLSAAQTLNNIKQWGLDSQTLECYACALAGIVEHPSDEKGMERIVGFYHAEHETVEILGDNDHVAQSLAWQSYTDYITAIVLQSYGNPQDVSFDLDDLQQEVLFEVALSIKQFRYESSLKTWMFRVVTTRIHEYMRGQRTDLRRINQGTASFEDLPKSANDHDRGGLNPMAQIEERQLVKVVETILRTHKDPRLLTIFMLRSVADLRITDIHQLLNLSQPRTTALWKAACAYLRQHPSIQQWHNE